MRSYSNTKLALFLAPLAFVLLGTGCDTISTNEVECTIDSTYKIKCEPIKPSDPFNTFAAG